MAYPGQFALLKYLGLIKSLRHSLTEDMRALGHGSGSNTYKCAVSFEGGSNELIKIEVKAGTINAWL